MYCVIIIGGITGGLVGGALGRETGDDQNELQAMAAQYWYLESINWDNRFL